MHKAYISAIQEHVADCIEDLDSLAEIAEHREWTRIERKAVERLLQILIEACIGAAKQWLKHQAKVVPSDARQTIQKLADYSQITHEEAEKWTKVIGMRNAIVHDYLNLDRRVLKAVVESGTYKNLQEFVLNITSQHL